MALYCGSALKSDFVEMAQGMELPSLWFSYQIFSFLVKKEKEMAF